MSVKKKDSRGPFSVWSEEELMDGRRTKCLTIILSTLGCAWWRESGGCLMCGYNFKSSNENVSSEDIVRQFNDAWKSFDLHSLVKIYTSGSFLDESELALGARRHILETVGRSGAKLLFESRPEFVSRRVIEECIDSCPRIELALGLESANDRVLKYSVGKGLSFADYLRVATEAREAGADIRTYLLLKPPFLTEAEAMHDVESSIAKISEISKVISINPVNVQRGTRVEKMWKSHAYRPPWLWSVVKILRDARSGNAILMSSTVAAGSDRGAHNCSRCDQDFIRAIEGFNLSQDKEILRSLRCDCKSRWERFLELEEFSVATSDLERFFSQ